MGVTGEFNVVDLLEESLSMGIIFMLFAENNHF